LFSVDERQLVYKQKDVKYSVYQTYDRIIFGYMTINLPLNSSKDRKEIIGYAHPKLPSYPDIQFDSNGIYPLVGMKAFVTHDGEQRNFA